ncbi:hypothetical protein [Bythopirellula polymerisocia]|uniref:Uncharacterized protein n=1 Tax=Bythopirellula polymerisocia TaxID=2528003 RepID=A0A5C6CDB4_9BACT|nr:hypothetical protein [Bythopirellula polymerisocia]TWU22843.1 hypothetical protein Pla144_43040 [Bythopirellula polymerisocia]
MSVQDHKKKIVIAGVLGTLVAAFLVLPSKYEKVSKQTYDLSSALYSSCNRHDGSRLAQVQKEIEAGLEKNEISTQEAQWLGEILHLAQKGNWTKARAKARQLMEDQVQYP